MTLFININLQTYLSDHRDILHKYTLTQPFDMYRLHQLGCSLVGTGTPPGMLTYWSDIQ